MHEINEYITARYDRWLDYSRYHCGISGIQDEAIDVLNEVLCSLLQKDPRKLHQLISRKKNGYTELDFFVLRMIKLNAASPTSPYQSKYKSLPANANVDYTRIEIEDTPDEGEGETTDLLDRFNQVREAYESLDLSPLAKRVFEFRFFNDNVFSEWDGPESLKELYDVYNGVQKIIRKKIKGESIF